MRIPLLAIALSLSLPAGLLSQSAAGLGRSWFNGLKARVATVRFFESAGGIPDPKNRVAATRFDALTTRFINLELELEYAKAAKRTPIRVECHFEGPAGAARDLVLSGNVEAGWTGSYHAGGTGSPERGRWAEGVYKVGCREAGQLVVATEIEVVKSAAAVRKLGAAVVQMKFFQSQTERLPVETRRYSTRFDTRTAQWIKTEFALVYPQASTPVTFTVECAYVFPDNSVQRVSVERQIPAGWTGSVHAQGIAVEHWPVGKYSVSCWNNGEKMAERRFEIFDSGVGNRESGAGKLKFFARKDADTAAAPASAASFVLGSYDTLYTEASMPVRMPADSASFGCVVTDPAGITSGFALKGEVLEKEKLLVARGPVGTLDPPKLRGAYRVECRTGARALVTDRFEVTGKPDLADLDARLVGVALFAGGDEPPGDEAVADVVFSVAKLGSLWLVALLDHPVEKAGALTYSCKVTGLRNLVVSTSEPQSVPVAAGDRTIVLRQRLAPAARQRWVAGKYSLTCASGGTILVKEGLDLTR